MDIVFELYMRREDRIAKLENEVKKLKSDIRAKEIWENFQKEHNYFKR